MDHHSSRHGRRAAVDRHGLTRDAVGGRTIRLFLCKETGLGGLERCLFLSRVEEHSRLIPSSTRSPAWAPGAGPARCAEGLGTRTPISLCKVSQGFTHVPEFPDSRNNPSRPAQPRRLPGFRNKFHPRPPPQPSRGFRLCPRRRKAEASRHRQRASMAHRPDTPGPDVWRVRQTPPDSAAPAPRSAS